VSDWVAELAPGASALTLLVYFGLITVVIVVVDCDNRNCVNFKKERVNLQLFKKETGRIGEILCMRLY
jgi:hypothetical protein